jgi:hypothetical protein
MLSVSHLNLDSTGIFLGSVADPDLIWIQPVQCIRIPNSDPDPGGQKLPKKKQEIQVLRCLMFSCEG